MSNHLAIAAVTTALKEIVDRGLSFAGLGATAALRRPFLPTGDPPAGATIYLYSAAPNGALRNADLPFRTGDQALVGRPQAALTLDYLISFYGDEARLEPQRLLGGAVASLHADAEVGRQVIRDLVTNAGGDTDFLVATDLDQQPDLVRFSPLPLDMEELSRLWSTFVQVPYVLSVAYRASVVLIEPPFSPRRPLPVRERDLRVMQMRRPQVDSVAAAAAGSPAVPGEPILPGLMLVLRGRRLRGDMTWVRVGGTLVEPADADVTDDEVRVLLGTPTFPPGALRAGILGAQVVHLLAPGRPAVESNVTPFVLRPNVVNAVHGVVANPPAPPQQIVTVTTDPPVRKAQRTTMTLSEPPGGQGGGYSFTAERRADDVSPLVVPIDGVAPGDYLVRVHVDDAESLIVEGPPGQFTPTVTIP